MNMATKQELEHARSWAARHFAPASARGDGALPFSFRYGGVESGALVGQWSAEWADTHPEVGIGRRTLTLTDPTTGLRCRCEVTTFAEYPAVEWVVYLKNAGQADTPILADIQPLDVILPLAEGEACTVHHALGSECHYGGMAAIVSEVQYSNFAPLETVLSSDQALQLASIDGRSSHGSLPTAR